MPQPLPLISVGGSAQETLPLREADLRRPILWRSAPAESRQIVRICKREDSSREGPEPSVEPRGLQLDADSGRAPINELKRILLIGSETVLLRSRCDILKRFGYEVTYHHAYDSVALTRLTDIALVHLCQTLEPRLAAELARRIRALSPDTLIIYTEKVLQPEPEEFDEILPPLLHPTEYVRIVSSLLGVHA